jgi:hypothetical protein
MDVRALLRSPAPARPLVSLALASAFATTCGWERPARSEDPTPSEAPREPPEVAEARRVFTAGITAQEGALYEEAIALYERANRLAPSPRALFNLGTCEERLGRPARAFDAYARAKELALARGATDVGREASARLAALEAQLARVSLRLAEGPSDASATLDGTPMTLHGEGERVTPGTHHLVVRSPTRERVLDTRLELRAGDARVVDVDLGLAPARPADGAEAQTVATAARSSSSPDSPYLGAALAGGAAVVLGSAAIVTFIVGQSRRDRYVALNAAPTTDNRGERADLRSSGQAFFVANDVLVAATAVAIGVGIYFLVRPRTPPVARAAALAF